MCIELPSRPSAPLKPSHLIHSHSLCYRFRFWVTVCINLNRSHQYYMSNSLTCSSSIITHESVLLLLLSKSTIRTIVARIVLLCGVLITPIKLLLFFYRLEYEYFLSLLRSLNWCFCTSFLFSTHVILLLVWYWYSHLLGLLYSNRSEFYCIKLYINVL